MAVESVKQQSTVVQMAVSEYKSAVVQMGFGELNKVP